MDLYTDNNPKNTIHGTGFKDEKTALKTFKLIKNRSLYYQFTVINTLYNRAKYHPHQTDDMRIAMKIFKSWLIKYPKLKKKEDAEFKFLSLDVIKKYEKIANELDVARVTRGLDESTKTDEGFLKVFKKVKGNVNKLCFIPVHKDKPTGQDYYSYRISFIKSRLGQMKKSKTKFFDEDGQPTKQHIILIMNAFSDEL